MPYQSYQKTNPNTIDWYADIAPFELTNLTTDNDIKSALFADLIFQMRLREKTSQPHDRGELEDMQYRTLIDAVRSCRDRIKTYYDKVAAAYVSNPPSDYQTMDHATLKQELNTWIEKNPNNDTSTLKTDDDIRSFMLSKHIAWNFALKRCISLEEISTPPKRKFSYYHYDSDEYGLALFHIRDLKDNTIQTMDAKQLIRTIKVYNNHKQVESDDTNYVDEPLENLRATVTNIRNTFSEECKKKSDELDTQYIANLRDDQIEQLQEDTLIILVQTYHRLTKKDYEIEEFKTMNEFSLKAAVVRFRDDIRKTKKPSQQNKQITIFRIDANTSNKQLETLSRDEMVFTLKTYLHTVRTGTTPDKCDGFSKKRLSSELKLIRNMFIKELQKNQLPRKQNVFPQPQPQQPILPPSAKLSMPSTFRQSVGNLNGIDIERYNPRAPTNTTNYESAPDLDKGKYKVVMLDTNIIYVRVNVPVNQTQVYCFSHSTKTTLP